MSAAVTSVRNTEIQVRKQDDLAAWERFVSQFPAATPLHSTKWMKCLESVFGYKPLPLCAYRGDEIVGVLPLFHIKNFVEGSVLVSSPFAVYGGPCAIDDQSRDALIEAAAVEARKMQVDHLELRFEKAPELRDFHANTLYVAFRGKLIANADDMMKALPRDTRYMIRKSLKSEMHVRHGREYLRAFYELFCLSMQKLGTPVFPLRWFESLFDAFGHAIHLMMVYKNDEPVTGVISFTYGDTVAPYYAGAGPSANKYSGNNFMYWELMKWAAERGLRRFDFGRSKRGTGAYSFKCGWGMEEIPLEYRIMLVRRTEVPNFSPLNPKIAAVSRVWQKLPLPVTKLIGPRVVRLFP